MNLFPFGARGCPVASAAVAAVVWSKLICEVAQMMTGAHLACMGSLPADYPGGLKHYKATQGMLNHPMSRWVRACRANYDWAARYAEAMNARFFEAFGKPDHASIGVVRALAARPPPVFSDSRVGVVAKKRKGAPVVYHTCTLSPAMAACTPFPLLYQMGEEDMVAAVGTLEGRPLEDVVAALVRKKKGHLFPTE